MKVKHLKKSKVKESKAVKNCANDAVGEPFIGVRALAEILDLSESWIYKRTGNQTDRPLPAYRFGARLKYRMLFQLSAMTGARQSEIFGLMWKDVDFDASQINISHAYVRGEWTGTKKNHRAEVWTLDHRPYPVG